MGGTVKQQLGNALLRTEVYRIHMGRLGGRGNGQPKRAGRDVISYIAALQGVHGGTVVCYNKRSFAF